jgi:hypothetical protein
MPNLKEIIYLIELHDADGLRNCFAAGISPNELYNGLPLFFELIGEYTRSPRFKDCVAAFVEYGLDWKDDVLVSILLDDAASLEKILNEKPGDLYKKYTLRTAYTPIYQAGLLHLCAEFNLVECAGLLLKKGLSVNDVAGLDSFGFGGQTPIFHTVNQNQHQSEGMLNFLLANDANLHLAIRGLVWGKGYEWETFIPAVNPISYTMMGLLPQMHRSEKTIMETITVLLKHAYGIEYTPENIPNKYLAKR